ncbi:MAG: transglutaminase domain-containing protein, partial [Pyrinomonadaceae bacterium]
MRKRFLFTLVLSLLSCGPVMQVRAQDVRVQAREAEWQGYSLPKANFIRQTGGEKEFLFRVPADWKQEAAKLTFNGPHSAKLKIIVERVSDGMPLPDYVAAIMRTVRNAPGAAESSILRRAQIQDLEARELVLEMPDLEGEMTRSVLWVTVNGPLAVSFSFVAPLAHVAEVEPYFKAVVQSVMFVRKLEYAGFEAFRTTTIKTSLPASISELDNIVAILNEPNGTRESSIARLTSLFASSPDTVIDLLLDRRPIIRAAAIEALARSKNSALEPFLWRAVGDPEPLVAEHAARAVASSPDVFSKITELSFEGLRIETLARLWPFLGKEKRSQILQTIFSRTAVKPSPSPSPTPPPKHTRPQHDVKVSVGELTTVVEGKLAPLAAASNGLSFSSDASVQMGALTLLRDVTPGEFKLPLARIIAADYNVLTAVALQTAIERAEPLPVDLLLKLLTTNDPNVKRLAAENLGLSAGVSDIDRLEGSIVSLAQRLPGAKDPSVGQSDLAEELRRSIKKIRFRHQLTAASKTTGQSPKEIIKEGLSDSQLAEFVWRYVCEATPGACVPAAFTNIVKPDFVVKPLGENLLPEKVEHFAAVPNPGRAVQKFYESLQGIQMDSARGQSNLVLMMGGVRKLLGTELAAPPDASLIDYTGIKADAPISLAGWIAVGAPQGISSARHQAIILRVSDRERFARMVEVYQRNFLSFAQLPTYFAAGSRSLAALPAILPLISKAISAGPAKPKPTPLLKYSFVSHTEWNGFPVTIIEHRQVDSVGKIENSATYLTFLGDTAILTPNMTTLRDLLGLSSSTGKDPATLASNPEFRRAVESGGDVIYFSDLKALLAGVGETKNSEPQPRVKESGELKISKSSWENSYRLSFDESDWSKSLLPFKPGDLSAPRDLLPASTVAYYFMKVDMSSAWSKWAKSLFGQKEMESLAAFWSLNFEKDVLPELGPECGAVLLDLPDMGPSDNEATWAAFCKLKWDKLQNAFAAGKLFRDLAPGSTEIKREKASYFVALKNGFLVFSNRATGLDLLDHKEKLASTRDYSRAAEKAPAGIVAFGGYNLEAAITAASTGPRDGLNAQVAEVVASLARAFHSQNFFATASAGTVEAQSSVAMDRQGRYAVSDLSYRPTASNITYATVEPRGIPIVDQGRLSHLVLRIRARAAGAIEPIRDDVKSPHQTVEQTSPDDLVITVASRRAVPEAKLLLPINDPGFATSLNPSGEIKSDDERVINQAREIVGEDRDAWSVARKLSEWTHTNLEWKFVASADAGKTLATREADCSEFSQLYVAMARSLGLPARIVSGLAYGGTSFGGHAWVEVWVGRWIELDPTWGTDFVDATHIRNDSSALLTYA